LRNKARFDYAQSEYMSAALRYVQSAFFADFVCFLDADEFVSSPDRSAFLADLAVVPVGHASEHVWENYLPDPTPSGGEEEDWLSYMIYCRDDARPYVKCFIRLAGGTEPNLNVLQGNHGFRLNRRPIPAHRITSSPLRHFPVRSARQIVTKGAVGWTANLARKGVSAATKSAYQWKRLYELARKGVFHLSRAELCNEAMAYAQADPTSRLSDKATPARHGITNERRYSDGQPADPYRTIATSLLRTETYRPFDLGSITAGKAGKSDVATAFDGAWHWQNFFLDAPPFRYLAQKHRPESVLDVGCGTGLYLRLMQHDGVRDVLGIDGMDVDATALDPETYRKIDLQQPYDAGRRFDLVLCLEVAEHIPPEAMPVLLDTIETHASGLIVFSMAEPGQPGNGHINCRTMEDVLAMWKARGWTPDLIETLGVRALSTMAWFRRNIVVLRRGLAEDPSAADALVRIAKLDYAWYFQERGLRQTAFEQAFPPLSSGYGRLSGQPVG
jgi:SAM-dependent methyltransferase